MTPQMTLRILQTALLCDGFPVPATKLMGRTLRTPLPKSETTNFENKPKRHDSIYIYIYIYIHIYRERERSRDRQREQTLKPVQEGDNIRRRDTRKDNWMRKAKVVEQHKSIQSYIVKNKDGNHLRRNRSHLLLTRETSLNGSLDNKMNDCDHKESDRTETL